MTRTAQKDSSWMVYGACVGEDPSIFFPERGEYEAMQAARAICSGCPVRQRCHTYAFTPPEEKFGVWAGLSERERKRIRKARARRLRVTPMEVAV